MKQAVLLFMVSFYFGQVQAQDPPPFFPEDIESNTLQMPCLCKPGVTNKSHSKGLEISFLHTMKTSLNEEAGYPLTDSPSELTLQNLIFKLRVPVVNKAGFKVIAGVIYRPEHFDFQTIGTDYQNVFTNLDDKSLKSSGFEGFLSKSLNEKYYLTFRTRALFNGDYGSIINFDNRFGIFNVSGLFGVKKQADKEWGVGLNFSHSFRSTILLPFFLYNQTFNDKWGIEMALPALANLRYNASERSVILLGFKYSSRSYSVDVGDSMSEIYNMNHSRIRGTLSFQQQIHPWAWVELATGMQYNFSTDFEAKNDIGTSFKVEPGISPFFKVGLFLSPPDSFVK